MAENNQSSFSYHKRKAAPQNRHLLKILVFPCGSEISMEIHNALKWSTHFELIGVSSVVSNHGKYVYKNYFDGFPFIEDDAFISILNTFVVEKKIDLIFPAHDSVVLKLSENRQNIHCKIIGSPYKTCSICRSKLKTYNFFKNLLNVPEVYTLDSYNIHYPVFMKPNVGQGSRGVVIARNEKEVFFHHNQDPSLLILEFLPGSEYTVDCFSDRFGSLRFIGARERMRISNGISVNTKPIHDKKINEIAAIINKTLKFRGAWFFQLKKNKKDEYTLLEIGPRISGSMGLYRNLGINFPLLSVFDQLGNDVVLNPQDFFIEMDRALFNRFNINLNYKHVYIDFDDTIILDGKINTLIIYFLYQCINRNIKIHLISKHKNNLDAKLKKFRIKNIFDTIMELVEDDEKSNYITEKSSIFIDDSYSERQKVSKTLGIPVFDTHAVESLLDWKV
ncbi:MAG: ATP-grasp domain-containing protein [Candidatus Latescibacteria bacterium]|nr:ATP-grasp domain-containing protein [Candidatus Latescibacterota bacterium]